MFLNEGINAWKCKYDVKETTWYQKVYGYKNFPEDIT